jgi:hypothetical protein
VTQSDTPAKRDEIIAFLLGEGPLNGLWFGDELPAKGRYWWRSILREAFTPEKAFASAVPDSIPADVLRQHYLANMVCDEENHRDNPICACSAVNLGWHLSVGDAVEAWMQHVLAEARKASPSASGDTSK